MRESVAGSVLVLFSRGERGDRGASIGDQPGRPYGMGRHVGLPLRVRGTDDQPGCTGTGSAGFSRQKIKGCTLKRALPVNAH